MTELSERHDDPFALDHAALAVLDDRGTVVGWSRRAQELLGHPDTDVIGRPAFDVLADDRDLSAVKDAAARCGKAGGWVAQMAERWGTRYTREGKTVWTEQPLAGTPTSGSSSGS